MTHLKVVAKRDFPGGLVVRKLPSNAGDAGSIPGWGTRILHVTTTELVCHDWRVHARQLKHDAAK